MIISLNGEKTEIPCHVTLLGVLESLGFSDRHLVVELNMEIIPRERWADLVLREGDQLELIGFVGGGSRG
ncbi:MAG: sulfur carrier protein ThiS [Leptospirales bacterium]